MSLKISNRAKTVLGVAGSIASIVALWLVFYPPEKVSDVSQLTIFVTDAEGNVVLEHEGVLNAQVGHRPLRETIGEHGRTNFDDILSTHIGDTILVGLDAKGWEIADHKNIFIFDGEPIYLRVKPDNNLGLIKGSIVTRDGQSYIQGAEIRINNDTIITSDKNGIYSILLPGQMRISDANRAYNLTVLKDGFKTKKFRYYVKSSNLEIRLETLD